MTFLSSLLTWANVPFIVALGVAVTFVFLQISGILGLLAGGSDHEAESDADVDGAHDAECEGDADADSDVDADSDADADSDTDADSDADADSQAQHGSGARVHSASAGGAFLATMGVGTMPLSIVWQSFFVLLSLGGVSANTVIFTQTGALPASALAISGPFALLFAYGVTRLVSKVFGRFAPAPGKTSTTRKDLVGKTGTVISSTITADFGEVRLTDASGIVHRIVCRALPGEPPMREGCEVVFVEYDREKSVLYVAPLDIDALSDKKGRTARKKQRLLVSAEPEVGDPESQALANESVRSRERRSEAVL